MPQTVVLLTQRFARDARVDWKRELVRRRTDLAQFQAAATAADDALATAEQQLAAAEAALQEVQAAAAAARAAAEEEGLGTLDEVRPGPCPGEEDLNGGPSSASRQGGTRTMQQPVRAVAHHHL